MKVHIRHSDFIDLDDILKLHKTSLPHLKWSYNRKYIEEVLRGKDNSECFSLIGEDKFIGFLHLYLEKDYLWLNTIAVDPLYRGLGCGRKLIQFAEAHGIDLEYPIIKLWTSLKQSESHLKYYEDMGYVRFGRDKKWQGLKKVLV